MTSIDPEGMRSEGDKLVKTYLSVPVTSSTAERSFSLCIVSRLS